MGNEQTYRIIQECVAQVSFVHEVACSPESLMDFVSTTDLCDESGGTVSSVRIKQVTTTKIPTARIKGGELVDLRTGKPSLLSRYIGKWQRKADGAEEGSVEKDLCTSACDQLTKFKHPERMIAWATMMRSAYNVGAFSPSGDLRDGVVATMDELILDMEHLANVEGAHP